MTNRRIIDLIRRPEARLYVPVDNAAFHPSQLASYYADYNADLGVEEASGDPAEAGDSVEFWRDQNGVHHATQGTASSRPTYRIATGPNGKNLLEFNQSATPKFIDASSVVIPGSCTIFSVARFDTVGTTNALYDGILSRRALFKSGATWIIFSGGSAGLNTGLPPGGWFLDEAVFAGASSTHKLNNGTLVTGNPGGGDLDGLRIANVNGTPSVSLGFDGDIARIIIFNAVLSDNEKAKVRQYLADLYGEPAWGTKTPTLSSLVDWWHSNGLSETAATPTWRDDGIGGHSLTRLSATPINLGISIDGWKAFSGDGVAMENASATLAASTNREFWIVMRTDDLSATQYAIDGVGASDRCTLTVSSTGVVTVNAGSDVSSASGEIEEHRPTILRVTIDSAGTCNIYKVSSQSTAISSPIATGTSGVGLWTGITVGADNAGASSWQGEIAEILRYSDILNDDNAKSVASYFLSRYPSAAKITRTARNLILLGDSLVQGPASASGRSFRLKLFQSFEQNDISATETLIFRGTNEDRCLDHDGVGGETISEIEARAASTISSHSPDVIVVMAGANDIVDAGYSEATALSNYASLLSTIYTAAPSTPVVVCLTPPMTDAYSAYGALVESFNSALTSTIIPAASNSIIVVDPRNYGWTGTGYTTDGVHPNSLGEQALSSAIEFGIRSSI